MDKIKKEIQKNTLTLDGVKDAMRKMADVSADVTNKIKQDIDRASSFNSIKKVLASAQANIDETAKTIGEKFSEIYELIKDKH